MRDNTLTRETTRSRRLLAAFCVICMVALQCFVVMPALSGQAYADTSVDFVGEYSNGTTATKNNSSWITKASASKKITIEYDTGEVDDEGNPIIEKKEYQGRSLSDILKNAKLSDSRSSVSVNDWDVSVDSTYLIKEGDSWYLYDTESQTMSEDPVYLIRVSLDKNPIKLKKLSASSKKPKVGETITITYKMDVDPFYKSSDEYSSESSDVTKLEWSGNKKIKFTGSKTTTGTSGTVSVKIVKSGDVKITAKAADSDFSYMTGDVSFTGKTPKLSASPSSVKLKVGETKTISVKENGSSVTTGLSWSSSNTSVATVYSGVIRGVKEGKATVTVKSSNPNTKAATISVTVSGSTYTTSSYRPGGGYTYRPGTRASAYTRSSSSGSALTTTATRPATTETSSGSTVAPSFQTMSVKEVYLTPMEATQDEYGEDGAWEDESWEDEGEDGLEEEETDYDDGVTFPAAAGSAAAAALACGAGAVGRVRRFKMDMGGIAAAAGMVKKAASPVRVRACSARSERANPRRRATRQEPVPRMKQRKSQRTH